MIDVQIRPATSSDMNAVAAMTRELAKFQKMPDGPRIQAKELQRDGFETQPPAFRCLIAESQESSRKIVGYTMYFPAYSIWHGRSMILQDLYVKFDERRRGVGQKLFDAVAKEAFASGCKRIDFHVLKWNDARYFYEKKGALNLTETEGWCVYRLTGDALLEAAKRAN